MRISRSLVYGAAICASSTQLVNGITLDVTSEASILDTASTVAWGMMAYYTGNHTGDVPGNLPSPYYWWEAGAMFGVMVDYWYYTGDTTYNAEVKQALVHQAGDDGDFMPTNQTKTEGNDDQGFWGMAAMTAAEANFTNPDSSDYGWLACAQGVYNDMIARWDTSTCGGGLRWQIFTFNSGYNYKNSIANGCLFNLAARLARYTGDSTYADWATKVFDWTMSVGLIGTNYEVYDGTSDTSNCSSLDHLQWSYNAGIFLYGAAMMYNHTNGSTLWQTRVNGLLNETLLYFFNDAKVMQETACENAGSDTVTGNCDADQQVFKAYLARWLAATLKVAPYLLEESTSVMSYINASATAAALQCSGGTTGQVCGQHWTAGSTYDGLYGVGEQMSALSVIQSTLILSAANPVTNATGGTSAGNANAGSAGSSSASGVTETVTTTADKAGAGILTALVVSGAVAGTAFMVLA